MTQRDAVSLDALDALHGMRLLGSGTFRIDRRRAREKLAHFQLAHPEHFVLELLAAGIRAGASELHVRHDADDIAISWPLTPSTPEADPPLLPQLVDLQRLFDWLFSRAPEAYPRMLQHIAQGVFGALGTDPARVTISVPGWSVELADPDQPVCRAHTATGAPRCTIHVRRRFGLRVARDALLIALASAVRREATVVQSLACWSPVAIVINGEPLDRGRLDPPPRSTHHRSETEALWFEPERDLRGRAPEDDLRDQVALIRDGVRVESLTVRIGALRLRGWIRHDALELDASRARVVDDHRRREAIARLHARFASLIHGRLTRLGAYHRLSRPLQHALVELVHDHPDLAGHIRHVPTLHDATRRAWSLGQLARARRILRLREESLAHADIGEPHFVALDALPEWIRQDPRAREVLQWGVLAREVPERIVDADAELRRRAVGRAQREYQRTVLAALRGRVPGTLEAHEFAIEEGQLSRDAAHAGVTHGVVHLLDASHLPPDRMRVELRVDGLPCETVSLPHAGPLLVRVAAPGLRANDSFDRVQRDERFQQVLELVHAQAHELVCQLARALPGTLSSVQRRDIRVREFLWRWCQGLELSAAERGAAQALAARIPADLRACALFEALEQRANQFSATRSLRSLDEILRIVAADGAIGFVRCELGGELVPHNSLSLSEGEIAALHNLLGPRLVDRSEDVLDDRVAARRRASAGSTAMIDVPARHHVRFDEPGLRGEFAIADEPEAGDCRVLVVHEGVDLGRHELPLGLPGTVATVDWDDAAPNRAWTDLRDRPRQLCALVTQLSRFVPQLLESATMRLSLRVDDALPPWLVGAVVAVGSFPDSLLDQPCFGTLSGAVYSPRDLATADGAAFLSSIRALEECEQKIGIQPYFSSDTPSVHTQHSTVSDGFSAAGLRTILRVHVHGDRGCASLGDDILILDPARQLLVAYLLGGGSLRSCDEALATLLASWERYSSRPRAAPSFPASVAMGVVEFSQDGLAGVVTIAARGATTDLRVQAWFAGRPLCTRTRPSPVPIAAAVWGAAIVPNITLDGWVSETAAVREVRRVIPTALERATGNVAAAGSALSADTLARHAAGPRRAILAALLVGGALELPKPTRTALLEQLRCTPLFSAVNQPRLLSVTELEALARRNSLALLPAGGSLNADTMDDDALRLVFVHEDAALRALQAAEFLPNLPRRDDLVRTEAASAPARPTRVVAEAEVTHESAQVWVGFGPPGERPLAVHRWRVDGRRFAEETSEAPSAVETRSTDLALHDRLQLDGAIRRRTLVALTACLDALARELAAWAQHGERRDAAMWQAPGDLQVSVTVHEPLAALSHITHWCAAGRMPESVRLLRLYPCLSGPALPFAELVARAEREPLLSVAPGSTGTPIDPRPMLLANDPLRGALSSVFGAVFDASESLAREEDAQILAERPLEGIRGWLQVRSSGEDNLWICAHDGTSHRWHDALPVPLVGVLAPAPGDPVPDPADLLDPLATAGQTMLAELLTRSDLEAPALWTEVIAREYVDPINDRGHSVVHARERSRDASPLLTRLLRRRWLATIQGRLVSLADCLRGDDAIEWIAPATVAFADPSLPAVVLAERAVSRLHPWIHWAPGLWILPPDRDEISSPRLDMTRDSVDWLARGQLELTGRCHNKPVSLLVLFALARDQNQPGMLEWIDGRAAPRWFALPDHPGVVLRVERSATLASPGPCVVDATALASLERAVRALVRDVATSVRDQASASLAELWRTARATRPGGGLARAPWLPRWRDVPLWREPGSSVQAGVDAEPLTITLGEIMDSFAQHGCVLVGSHRPAGDGPLVVLPGEVDERLLAAAIGREAIVPVARWRPQGQSTAARARANRGVLRDRVLALLDGLADPIRVARATVNEAMDRRGASEDSGYDAALADPRGRAGLVFAWSVADQLLAESGDAARCLELAARLLGHAAPPASTDAEG
ncbi:MAG: hypothetical protein H6713_42100 [Myxococcales bacterium]|nr:hypothetical protein [Myxococcales bacterium]